MNFNNERDSFIVFFIYNDDLKKFSKESKPVKTEIIIVVLANFAIN